ncbi:hypothetical protein B0H66DRAFT_35836 [Apodospora peruviana]|uniref:Meiotically up-regulated protein Msb1/Mug8 domain-containing protein n=1 Tax=Apodospora peruviana TaxID=516989 RepID=A0AAE0IR72_9PEZI|nr:hypothetical protein B0H66DRAFT_35836 [Apodospora peruviana]
MPSLFSRLKGGKDGQSKSKSKKNGHLDKLADLPPKKQWEDAWTRKTVEPEEVQELVHLCTKELKDRALDLPFLLLPFRPTSDPSAVRTFVRHFFNSPDGYPTLRGEALAQELRLTEPMVMSGVIKWCWSRLQGGVVGWDSYELFKVGEQDSNFARDSFKTFIPLSIESPARSEIIFNFFDLLSAIAAHGKMNGFGGRKLSRMAAWWAFEQKDTGNGFEGGYNSWLSAADATSHLFFAYLRSLAPEPVRGGISLLPMSLQKLLQETEYPPQRPALMQSSTNRVSMIVDSVSPTPFALLRRANHFQYRDDDRALREWSEYEDPISALTEECRRVLRAVSAANQSQAVSSSKHSTSLRDASWSRFEDIGFASALEEEDEDDDSGGMSPRRQGLRSTPASGTNLGRPTTPSWADFLSSGFVDDKGSSPSHLLPPDKVLPPIESGVRQRSSQSHKPRLETEHHLEPGELASIVRFDLDDAFWWVWMSSLAPEETPERKAAFGRCAVIETVIRTGRWLVMEELVKGAAPDPAEGAYIAEKKSFFSWTRRNRDKGVNRRKSTGKNALEKGDGSLRPSGTMGFSKTSIGPDQQARIQAAAHQLQMQEKQKSQQKVQERRGRNDAEVMAEKTNSIMTLQPGMLSDVSPAVQWANKYDKEAIREAYLANANLGRGQGGSSSVQQTNGYSGTPTTNGYDRLPELPPKSPSLAVQPSPVGLPKSPSFVSTLVANQRTETPEPELAALTEKAFEAPKDVHPVERVSDAGRSTPLPPLPNEPESMELARENMISPEPGSSPESKKHKKLHKEMAKGSGGGGGGGFRKLFGRNKNRQSKLPENAGAQLSAMTSADEKPRGAPSPAPPPAPPAAQPYVPEKPPVHREETQFMTPMEQPESPIPTQVPAPLPVAAAHEPEPEPSYEPTYEPPVHEEESRVNTADAAEASNEFARFDQGPLPDMPAFIPDEGDDADDAVPPPIARHPSRSPIPSPQQPPAIEEQPATPTSAKVDPQDRWAQIRKNAAERAAQRLKEEKAVGGLPKPSAPYADADDDTSGEETIESRVARIKARVAELTSNAEGTTAPGNRTPPTNRGR